MHKTKYKLIVVLPIGPTCKEEYILDTIDSIFYYSPKDTKIIMTDDSQTQLGDKISLSYKDITVINNKKRLGKGAGLYITLCKAFKYAIENYTFNVLLRMDTDALLIGKNIELVANNFFKKNPKAGIIGSYKLGYDGDSRDYSWPKKQLLLESSILSLLKGVYRFRGILELNRLLNNAKRHSYILGEHCMGGAAIYSYNCVKQLHTHNMLPDRDLYWSGLPEDVIFGLLVKSIGIEMADYNGRNLPFGIRWQGLPDSPKNLFNNGNLIIHSIKNSASSTEKDIREFFKQKRHNYYI